MSKKINLTKVEIVLLDGTIEKVDFSKELASIIYNSTPDIGDLALAMDLYKHGEVERTDANIEIIKKFINPQYLKAFVQVAVNKLLNKEIEG